METYHVFLQITFSAFWHALILQRREAGIHVNLRFHSRLILVCHLTLYPSLASLSTFKLFGLPGICLAISPPINTDSREHHNCCTLIQRSSVSLVSINGLAMPEHLTERLDMPHCKHGLTLQLRLFKLFYDSSSRSQPGTSAFQFEI